MFTTFAKSLALYSKPAAVLIEIPDEEARVLHDAFIVAATALAKLNHKWKPTADVLRRLAEQIKGGGIERSQK
jgi:hypothetical protein